MHLRYYKLLITFLLCSLCVMIILVSLLKHLYVECVFETSIIMFFEVFTSQVHVLLLCLVSSIHTVPEQLGQYSQCCW